MSDTPRTDEMSMGTGCVPNGFARELERELNEANKWKEAVEEYCVVNWIAMEGQTPKEVIHKIACWANDLALDPSVSSDAVKLRDTYKAQLDAALERIKQLENQTHSTGMNL